MKRQLISIGGALACVMMTAPASAEPFVGASISRSEWPANTCGMGGACDRRGTAWSVRGGYMFLPWLGIEARYFDLGKSRYDAGGQIVGVGDAPSRQVESDAHGAGVGVVIAWPLSERFAVSGVAGIARTTAMRALFTTTVTDQAVVVSRQFLSGRQDKTYYALGVEYALTTQLSLSLEAGRFRLPGGGRDHVDTVGAGLTYRFR